MEKFTGIIQRVTYHNQENGWTVLKVSPIDRPHELKTVTVHQANVFAGATMEFEGEWVQHAKYGEQFKTQNTFERKPASASALEKYIGSGLIYGVGPKIAKRIVKHFGSIHPTNSVFWYPELQHKFAACEKIRNTAKKRCTLPLRCGKKAD